VVCVVDVAGVVGWLLCGGVVGVVVGAVVGVGVVGGGWCW